MKMIKLSEEHYIGVDKSTQPVNGLYYDAFVKAIRNTSGAEYGECNHCWQITHSTQPLEDVGLNTSMGCKLGFDKIEPLYLSEVKELLGEVDVFKKAERMVPKLPNRNYVITGYTAGYNHALQDNKDKKYTEDDLRKAIDMAQKESWDEGGYLGKEHEPDEIIQTLQPKTEWDVEFVDGKLKLI